MEADEEFNRIYRRMAAIHGIAISDITDTSADVAGEPGVVTDGAAIVKAGAVEEAAEVDNAADDVAACGFVGSDEATAVGQGATVSEAAGIAVVDMDVATATSKTAAPDEGAAIGQGASVDEAVNLAMIYESAIDESIAVAANETVGTDAACRDDITLGLATYAASCDHISFAHGYEKVDAPITSAAAANSRSAAFSEADSSVKFTLQTPLQTIYVTSTVLERFDMDWIADTSNLIVTTIFGTMLDVQLNLVSEDFRADLSKLPNDLVYAGVITRPIWKRAKRFNARANTVQDFLVRHTQITAKIHNSDQPNINMPFYLKLHYDDSPRVLKILLFSKEAAGSLEIQEFRVFLKSSVLRWINVLSMKPRKKGKGKNTRRAEARATPKEDLSAELRFNKVAQDSKSGFSKPEASKKASHATQVGPSKTADAPRASPSKAVHATEIGPSNAAHVTQAGLSKAAHTTQAVPAKAVCAPQTGPSKVVLGTQAGPSKAVNATQAGPSKTDRSAQAGQPTKASLVSQPSESGFAKQARHENDPDSSLSRLADIALAFAAKSEHTKAPDASTSRPLPNVRVTQAVRSNSPETTLSWLSQIALALASSQAEHRRAHHASHSRPLKTPLGEKAEHGMPSQARHAKAPQAAQATKTQPIQAGQNKVPEVTQAAQATQATQAPQAPHVTKADLFQAGHTKAPQATKAEPLQAGHTEAPQAIQALHLQAQGAVDENASPACPVSQPQPIKRKRK